MACRTSAPSSSASNCSIVGRSIVPSIIREPTPVSPLTSYILHPFGHPSSSPPVVPPPWLPPWPAPPSVMSSSPDAAAAACGSTFCQLTSSENWRLRSAMPLCLQRTWRLPCNPVGSVRWQRSASRRLPRLESPANRGTAIMQGDILPFGFLRSFGAQASGARSPPQSRLAG